MKKIFLSLALVLGTFVFAQDYYDTYPQNNGYEYYDSSYDYPDDYYYNYPIDYYPDQYYQGYYNDYRKAVYSVNWDQFFMQNRLSPFQINQIIALNNRFASFAAWDNYYRYNPDRWYYDRFYALQNILGPRVFVIYQNVYFHGRSPFVFYRNRFTNFYARRYPVRPMYRNVNINIYRVDRNNFREGFRNSGRNMGMIQPDRNNGMRKPESPRSGANGNNPGTIRGSENNADRNQSGNIRNSGYVRVEPGNNGIIRNNGGFRNGNEGNVRPVPNVRQENIRNNNGVRQNQNSERKMESRGNGGQRSSGSRLVSRDN